MFKLDNIDLPQLGYRGLEADLSEEEQAIQEVAHRFAEQVMRPIGERLDRMTPEEVVAEDSPLHDYMRQIHESGILDLSALAVSLPADWSNATAPMFCVWRQRTLALLCRPWI